MLDKYVYREVQRPQDCCNKFSDARTNERGKDFVENYHRLI